MERPPSDNGTASQRMALARLLIGRLERLSADSYWAHRSSGLRGSLLRCLEQADGGDEAAVARLEALIAEGFALLARGASEIRVPAEREP